jgi:hypothetical protein
MTKTTTMAAMIGGLVLGAASIAQAQATQAEDKIHVNVSAGGQFQSREFSPVTTFPLYDETGTVTSNQTVGSGFVFDVSGGYRVWRNLSAGVGISTFNGSGEAAALAAVPSPLFVGKPTLVAFDASDFGDLSQSNVAVNFQVMWTRQINDTFGFAIFAGPSVIRVKQEMPSVTADASSLPIVVSESKTTGKAGHAGVDFTYRVNPRYQVGAFVRYLGGEVDLPSAPKLKVGGVQVAGGIRLHY